MEKIVSGEMCSRIIICWRKMSGEICLGELFVGEKCESLLFSTIIAYKLPELLLPIIVGLSCSMKSINAYKLPELLSPIISGISCSMKSANAYIWKVSLLPTDCKNYYCLQLFIYYAPGSCLLC